MQFLKYLPQREKDQLKKAKEAQAAARKAELEEKEGEEAQKANCICISQVISILELNVLRI